MLCVCGAIAPLRRDSDQRFANSTGFEVWNSRPGGGDPRINNVIDGLKVYMTHGVAIFTPYSGNFVFNNVVLLGNVNSPGDYGAGYSGNGIKVSIAFNPTPTTSTLANFLSFCY